jgi:hypothetical protein
MNLSTDYAAQNAVQLLLRHRGESVGCRGCAEPASAADRALAMLGLRPLTGNVAHHARPEHR